MENNANPVPDCRAQDRVEAWRMFSALQADGLTQRSLLGRRIAHSCWPEIFDYVPFEADTPFCEPFLFSVALNREFLKNIPAIFKYYADHGNFNCINNYKYNFNNIFFVLSLDYPNLQLILPNAKSPEDHLFNISIESFHLLHECNASFFNDICASGKYVIPFAKGATNSFAHDAFPGMAFLNVAVETSRVSAAEDLVHQFMHCAFSNVEMSENFVYVKRSEDTISDYMNGPSSNRSISVLYHSALTEAASIIALAQLLERDALNAAERLEAIARSGFLINKFAIDLQYIEKISALGENSEFAYMKIIDFTKKYIAGMIDECKSFKYFEQGYNFSFAAFCAENNIRQI